MNEELRSAAEELETSKEELQSVNEELTTVNQELKIKIEELGLTNNDFQNLINSTDIARDLPGSCAAREAVDAAGGELFNLLATDIGRPLSRHHQQLRDVPAGGNGAGARTAATIERGVEAEADRWYLMRSALPHHRRSHRRRGR